MAQIVATKSQSSTPRDPKTGKKLSKKEVKQKKDVEAVKMEISSINGSLDKQNRKTKKKTHKKKPKKPEQAHPKPSPQKISRPDSGIKHFTGVT